MSEKMFSFKIDEEVLRVFKSKASFEGRTMSAILSEFMEEYVGKEKPKKEPIVIDQPIDSPEVEKVQKEWEEKNKNWLPARGSLDGGRTASTDEFTKDPESSTIENMGGAQI